MTLRIILAAVVLTAALLPGAEAPSSAEDLMKQVLALARKMSNIRKVTAEEYFETYKRSREAGLPTQLAALGGRPRKTFPLAGTVLDEGGKYKIATFNARGAASQ